LTFRNQQLGSKSLPIVFCILLYLVAECVILLAQSAGVLYNDAKKLQSDNKIPKAIKKFEEALEKAESERNIQIQMNCHLELAELQDNVINYKDALSHYEAFSELYREQMQSKTKILVDSVTELNTDVQDGMVQLEQKNNALDAKDSAIDVLTTEQLQSKLSILDLELTNQKNLLDIQESENRKNILLLVLALFVLLIAFVGRAYILKRRGVVVMRNKNYQIVKEKEKSDNLLLNILPEAVAEELKEFGKTTPLKYEMATVMFTDFKGFTKFSEKNSPEDLVAAIDHYFSAFDEIVAKHHIEKIKTIGDAYLCASGIPTENADHVINMIKAAFEFREFVYQAGIDKQNSNGLTLQMRIGIHSGPLVAGVVGSRKFAYDIWGDTVNIAARMEQSGTPGNINVSDSVYELAKDSFNFEFRGEVEAKNKGKMKMYFVNQKTATI